MKTPFLRSVFNLEYAAAAAVVLAMIVVFGAISAMLPETDETSFLDPIFERVDFINIEDVSLDAIFAMKDTRDADPRVVVINVGTVAPVPDARVAMLLYKLHNLGVRAIGVDVFFDRLHYERFAPEEMEAQRDALRQALADVPNVVVAAEYSETTLRPSVLPVPELDVSPDALGFANLTRDDDGVVRRFRAYRTVSGGRWLSLPVAVAQRYDSSLVRPLLDAEEEPQIIYYTGTYDQFQTLPMDDVIDGTRYDAVLRDAMVLVGYVNEGGFVYLNDTHKTPMGKRTPRYNDDGTIEMGVEGPDMSGVLIHATIISMLLSDSWIRPVADWVDWLIAFVVAYVSIALYRHLRTRAVSTRGVTALITTMLIVETVMVFFLPIIAFFYADTKISYDRLAAAVLMFIPANALVSKLRFFALAFRIRSLVAEIGAPLSHPLRRAFSDDEAFVASMRLQHAGLYLVHAALALECARRVQAGERIDASSPWHSETWWRWMLPPVDDAFSTSAHTDERYLYRYLAGKSDIWLRNSAMRSLLFSTQKEDFNSFVHFEEWELLLPRILGLYRGPLGLMIRQWSIPDPETRTGDARVYASSPGTSEAAPQARTIACAHGSSEELPLDPWCVYAECKLHRTRELFVYAGMIRLQVDLPPVPMYFGETIACDPALPRGVITGLRKHIVEGSTAMSPSNSKVEP